MIHAKLMFASFAGVLLFASTNGFAQQPLPAEGDETQLLAVLESDAELFDKAKACQRLAIIGTSKSVPVLAPLLADEKLSHYARFGLESNPSSDVDDAFRDALGRLSGEQLIGVVNSIGVRRDACAAKALIGLASNDNEQVAASALSSLGAIASPASVAAIQQSLNGKESLRVAAAEACLTAADTLLADGKNAEAAEIFTALGKADLPKHLNVAAAFRSDSIRRR